MYRAADWEGKVLKCAWGSSHTLRLQRPPSTGCSVFGLCCTVMESASPCGCSRPRLCWQTQCKSSTKRSQCRWFMHPGHPLQDPENRQQHVILTRLQISVSPRSVTAMACATSLNPRRLKGLPRLRGVQKVTDAAQPMRLGEEQTWLWVFVPSFSPFLHSLRCPPAPAGDPTVLD